MKLLNERIKTRRLQLGLSQSELADKLEYSDKSSISKIEKGKASVPFEVMIKLTVALDTSIGYLIGLTDDPDDKAYPNADYYLAMADIFDMQKRTADELKAELLQDKEYIEGRAADTIKKVQDALLAKVMEICKDPAAIDEAQRLHELELMPSRIGLVIDFLEANRTFLHKNMPGLVPTDES